MDYRNTADMVSLGLFLLLTGVVLLVVPDLLTIQYYELENALRDEIFHLGLVLFNFSGLFLFVVLVRWIYRVATKHSQDVRKRMDEMERP